MKLLMDTHLDFLTSYIIDFAIILYDLIVDFGSNPFMTAFATLITIAVYPLIKCFPLLKKFFKPSQSPIIEIYVDYKGDIPPSSFIPGVMVNISFGNGNFLTIKNTSNIPAILSPITLYWYLPLFKFKKIGLKPINLGTLDAYKKITIRIPYKYEDEHWEILKKLCTLKGYTFFFLYRFVRLVVLFDDGKEQKAIQKNSYSKYYLNQSNKPLM